MGFRGCRIYAVSLRFSNRDQHKSLFKQQQLCYAIKVSVSVNTFRKDIKRQHISPLHIREAQQIWKNGSSL